MRRRIIRSYLWCVGLSFGLGLILSLLLIARYYERGALFLAETVFLCFAFCMGVGLYLAWLLGEAGAKSYSESLQSISEQAAEIAERAAKESALIDDTTIWDPVESPAGELAPDPDDELARLKRTFRSMTLYLQQVNRQLKRKNLQFQTLLKSMQEGLLHLDAKGQVQLATEQLESLLGAARPGSGQLAARGHNYARLAAALQSGAEQHLPFDFEFKTLYPEARILRVYAAALDNHTSSLAEAEEVLLVLQDITRLKQLENMRRDFVSNVTHELKTPLTSICGYIELLRLRERDRQTQESFYEIMALEAERLMNLIQDLLTLAEIEQQSENAVPHAPERCELAAVTRAVAARLQPLAAALGVTLEDRVEEGLWVPGSADQQQHILNNLITNGLIYNRPGGFVRISASCGGGQLCCRVEDNGIGIPAAEQRRVFERFYRVDKARSRSAGGSGLGLSIVKHLSENLGGTLSLHSEEDKGSCFELCYPEND